MFRNKKFLLIAYKLLFDLLFISLVFFSVSLVADGLIPGIVSDHISFLRQIILIASIFGAIYVSGYFGKIKITTSLDNKKTSVFLTVISSALIFNSLIKINLTLSVAILAVSTICAFFLYKNIFEEKL